jgi:hypothetical protein
MSSACVLPQGHDGEHQCEYGDAWTEAAAKCLELCTSFDGWCIRDQGHDPPHWCGRHEY